MYAPSGHRTALINTVIDRTWPAGVEWPVNILVAGRHGNNGIERWKSIEAAMRNTWGHGIIDDFVNQKFTNCMSCLGRYFSKSEVYFSASRGWHVDVRERKTWNADSIEDSIYYMTHSYFETVKAPLHGTSFKVSPLGLLMLSAKRWLNKYNVWPVTKLPIFRYKSHTL